MLNDLQEIERLKEERNAIILLINYKLLIYRKLQILWGDSLELCIKALKIKESDIVVFCGVISWQKLRPSQPL
jgi:quinolinate synthase